jgi:hypothetical protein
MVAHSKLNHYFVTVFGSAALAGLVAHAPATAGGVSAGTLIRNTAVASYDEGGVARSVNSNTVTVRVDELLDVTLTSLDPGPVAGRPGEAVLTFELTNQGNGPEAFRLFANTAVAGNDFDTSFRAGNRHRPADQRSDAQRGSRDRQRYARHPFCRCRS